MADWRKLQRRVAGKWQIPTLLFSIGALAAGVIQAWPDPAEYPVDQAVAEMDRLLTNGLFEAAYRMGEEVLNRAALPESALAPVQLRLARAAGEVGVANAGVREQAFSRALEHYDKAQEEKLTLASRDQYLLGAVKEQAGRIVDALACYEKAMEGADDADLKVHVASLYVDRLGEPEAPARARLNALAEELGPRDDLRWWVLQEAMFLARESGRTEEAARLFWRHEGAMVRAGYGLHMDFLRSFLLFLDGKEEDAELSLRALSDMVGDDPGLKARVNWLLGRVLLGREGDGRPREASSFFEQVEPEKGDEPWALAARLGIAESLAAQHLEERAVEAFSEVIAQLSPENERRGLISSADLRGVLTFRAIEMQQLGDLEASLRYLSLVNPLYETIASEAAATHFGREAEIQETLARARQAEGESLLAEKDLSGQKHIDEARALFVDAADNLLKAAKLGLPNEELASDAHFRAADLFAHARYRDRAATLFRSFPSEFPNSDRCPQALFRLGQMLQAAGGFKEARDAYQDCIARFPSNFYGARSLYPLAQTFLALGMDSQDSLDLAERSLELILDDSSVFTPESREFGDALFLLGEIQNRRGKYEQSIVTLEQALEFYPDDPRTHQATFLLADSYRCSASAVSAASREAASRGEGRYLLDQAQVRFKSAKSLFRRLIDRYEARWREEADPLDHLYYQQALLYEADCAFDLMEHEQALALYESAAGLLSDSPMSLPAYIQMIRCVTFLGRVEEAESLMDRAQALVEHIDPKAYQAIHRPETQEDWRRYFAWLRTIELN